MTLPHEPADRDEQYDTDDPAQDRRRRIIGASIALVVAVALVLLTGFVWPGWLASKETSASPGSDSNSATAGGPTSSSGDTGADSSSAAPSQPTKSGDKGGGGSDDAAPGGGSGSAGGQHSGGAAAPSSARAAARAYADAVNVKDANKMVSMVCDLTKVETYTYVKYFEKQFAKADAKLALAGPTKMAGHFAVTRAHSRASSGGSSKSEDIVISMQKKSGRWCVPSRA
ncbi:MAG: hypothetical protein ACRDQ5_08245 [Sciscionella sp.]